MGGIDQAVDFNDAAGECVFCAGPGRALVDWRRDAWTGRTDCEATPHRGDGCAGGVYECEVAAFPRAGFVERGICVGGAGAHFHICFQMSWICPFTLTLSPTGG